MLRTQWAAVSTAEGCTRAPAGQAAGERRRGGHTSALSTDRMGGRPSPIHSPPEPHNSNLHRNASIHPTGCAAMLCSGTCSRKEFLSGPAHRCEPIIDSSPALWSVCTVDYESRDPLALLQLPAVQRKMAVCLHVPAAPLSPPATLEGGGMQCIVQSDNLTFCIVQAAPRTKEAGLQGGRLAVSCGGPSLPAKNQAHSTAGCLSRAADQE